MAYKSGFFSLIGCPNVGKSTLINALVGQKISIVTDRAQTTRNRITGVVTRDEYQMIFLDTPGMTVPKNRLGEYMQKTADGLLIHASADRMEFRVQRLAYAAFSGLAYCAVLLVVFIFLKRLCDGFRRCDTPFSEDVIHRMTVFAWVMVGGAVLLSAAESIGNSLINRSLDLSFSINPTGFNSGIECSFSFAPILIALLVLFLTMIFRYGAQLQKESDETL